MEGEGALLTIAEISVALAGFSSVVIALRGPVAGSWSPQDRYGLGIVLVASVGALVGSLLPFPLASLGWPPERVWAASNGVFGLLVLVAVGFLARVVVSNGVPPRIPASFWFFVGSGLALGAMLLLSAADLLLPRGPALLLIGLLWALLGAFAQLAAFVLVSGSERR